METVTLTGRTIIAGKCRGIALVTAKPISFLGGVDPETGTITEQNHDLHGQKIADKILCFPHGHGSTVGSYVLYALKKRGLAPKAIIAENADTVVTVGAIIAEIPMVDRIDLTKIRNGDLLEIRACEGSAVVKVWREEQCT